MLSLSAQKREILGKKVKNLREEGSIPAVLYGPKIKNLALKIEAKEFEKVRREAGESSLVKLKIKDGKFKIKEIPVLIKEVSQDPLSGRFLHIDFYQPVLTERIEAKVPILFEGTAPAVKELGGTLVKNISEIVVKALPEDLPHEIKVDLSKLKTFEDYILVKDLVVGDKVTISRESEEIVTHVMPPEKVEEELEKPLEEKVEEVEKVGEKKEEEEIKEVKEEKGKETKEERK